MNKRMIALALAVVTLLLVTMPAALANRYIKYVAPSNGKTLNVRAWPSTDATILGRLDYGTELAILGYTDDYDWAMIQYNGQISYVMVRYLSDDPPVVPVPTINPLNPTATPKPEKDYAAIISKMESEWRTYTPVTNAYIVTPRPQRATGWVNFRFAPTDQMGHIAKLYAGTQLKVLAETKNWLQVEEPYTGVVGYISRKYVTILGDADQ